MVEMEWALDATQLKPKITKGANLVCEQCAEGTEVPGVGVPAEGPQPTETPQDKEGQRERRVWVIRRG